ncbi:hypothetical protein ACFQL4_04770 [Halosimplex aquaticum]
MPVTVGKRMTTVTTTPADPRSGPSGRMPLNTSVERRSATGTMRAA